MVFCQATCFLSLYRLFPGDKPPVLEKQIFPGGRRYSRPALPDGVFRARGLFKATRPLTCTRFDPAISLWKPAVTGFPGSFPEDAATLPQRWQNPPQGYTDAALPRKSPHKASQGRTRGNGRFSSRRMTYTPPSCAVLSTKRAAGLAGRRGRSLAAPSRETLSSMYSRVACGTYFS